MLTYDSHEIYKFIFFYVVSNGIFSRDVVGIVSIIRPSLLS